MPGSVGRDFSRATFSEATATIIVLSQSLKSHFKAILGCNGTVNDLADFPDAPLHKMHSTIYLISSTNP